MEPELIQLKRRLVTTKSSFEYLRLGNSVYVDKTKYIYQMLEESQNTAYFLSRPRRFGKSLLIRTLAELFKSKKELFRDLYIYDKWDWDQKFSVVRLDLSRVKGETPEALACSLRGRVQVGAEDAYPGEIELTPDIDPDDALEELIRKLYKKYKYPVVVLIDEYDMPIVNHLLSPEKATMAKKLMHSFYKVLKENEEYLRFIMLTGISKFSGISVFSALNNLRDISLDPEYSAICGYTEAELDKYFAPFMKVVDRAEFREMYNGYNWLGDSVYNPIDVMLAIDKAVKTDNFHQFDSYWFDTGTPTFLVKLMQEKGVLIPNLKGPGMVKDIFTALNVEALSVEAILFQTGYLTIDKQIYDNKKGLFLYNLKYPNREVLTAYNMFFLRELFPGTEDSYAYSKLDDGLCKALGEGDCQKIFNEIHLFFASLSHRWYSNNTIDSVEGFYCGMLYAIFQSNSAYIEAESQTNRGQIDLLAKVGNKRYVIEVKVRENAKGIKGLEQILDKGYAEKFRDDGELYLVAMEFSRETRNIAELEYCMGSDGKRIKITKPNHYITHTRGAT